MEYNRAKEEIVNRWEEIIAQISRPAKQRVNGRTSYICPLCGHGNNGDGLTINPQSKDRKGLKCFGCDFSGDIIDLVGAVENITEYPEQLKRAGEYLGITVDGRSTAQEDFSPASINEHSYNGNEQYTDMNIHTDIYTHEDTDYTEWLLQANQNIEKTDYHRGLSLDTLNRFKIGYVENWKHPKAPNAPVSPRLIIPTSRYSYIARDTRAELTEEQKSYSKMKVGKVHIFNRKALQNATTPIFVVEGEIDALSIIEVGGEAIATGSIANINLFIEEIKKNKPTQPLVLALDNDEKGQEAQEKLEKRLEEMGVEYYIYNPAGEHKDANEALTADRASFTAEVKRGEDPDIIEKEEYYQNTAYNHLQAFINGIAESVDTPAQPTGFTQLDDVLDGGLYEGLYIVGAITSLGKTTLALQIADQIADSGRDVLIFSLEMARAELMSKSISRLTLLDVLENNGDIRDAKTARGITAGARYANYSTEEQELIQRAITSYGAYAERLIIHEGVGDIGAEQIRQTVRKGARLAQKEGRQPPVVLVDYIQILAPHDVRATDKQNMDKAVLELKRISRDYKTPVIAISSLNRANYKTPISMEAFKESGGIEYGSDVVIGLQLKGVGKKDFDVNEAKQKDPREIELVILKNRNGKTGDTIAYEYYPLFNYFTEA